MVHNNPRNKIDGNRQKAAGMVSGVADLAYLQKDRPPIFIEMKLPEGKQSDAQIKWQAVAESTGARYIICRSLEQFKQIVEDARKK